MVKLNTYFPPRRMF